MVTNSNNIVKTSIGDLAFELLNLAAGPSSLPREYHIFPVQPHLPSHMSVLAATAVLLTIHPNHDAVSQRFRCSWTTPIFVEGEPQSGECLESQAWAIGNRIVTVGCEDGEALASRLPKCAFNLSNPNEWPVTYLRDGIEVLIPKISEGATITLHFVVVENHFPEPTESSSWFAADIDHAEILRKR